MTNLEDEVIKSVKETVIPATGCTEPVAVALASCIAASFIKNTKEDIDFIEAHVSANLMKNGMGVIVPGTKTAGLYIAAAIGAIGGNKEKELEVLDDITDEQVKLAKEMVANNKVTVLLADVKNVLYAQVKVESKNHTAKVTIADSHTNVVKIENDGKIIFNQSNKNEKTSSNTNDFWHRLSLKEIFDLSCNISLDKISFINEAARINNLLSKEGLENNYGLHIGKTLHSYIEKGFVGNDLLNKVLIKTVCASDARMGGALLPAMTNSGSGNQGITATEPVCAVFEFINGKKEDLTRALFLSHSVAIYIHSFLPKLSALCAASTAAMGAASGMAYLLDGNHRFSTIKKAISSMCGDMVGMVCDGAANSCSMKVASACSSAIRSVLLALDDSFVTGDEGLVADNIDETIRNIGNLACIGMKDTDVQILKIMLEKNKERSCV